MEDRGNEKGVAIITVLLLLAILTIIGLTGINTTITELQVARNDSLYKKGLYEADGGREFAVELLEQNISCPSGFTQVDDENPGGLLIDKIQIENLNFWQNSPADVPSDANRDIYYPKNYTGSEAHTNITVGGNAGLLEGAGIQVTHGYDGLGKGVGSGGALINYNIYAQHLTRDSDSLLQIRWRHVIGQEGACTF